MDTDSITKNFCEQALTAEKKRYESAANTYNSAIGLAGTTIGLKLVDKRDGTTIEISLDVVLREVTKQLLDSREERLKTKAVDDFLSKFNAFGNYMHQMENYNHEE